MTAHPIRLSTDALEALAWRAGVVIVIDNAEGMARAVVNGRRYEASLHDMKGRP